MTVSTVVDHNDYTGNGVTTSFPYTFRIFKKTDLTVSVIDLSENITVLVLDTDYTVTNAGGYNGGSVVLTTPLATGWKISVARELEPTQETDLRNQGKFFAEVHEDAFDKLTMLIQQVGTMFSLALRKPTSIANWYDALNNYIRNVKDPRDPQDAATKNYVDTLASGNLGRTLRVPEQIPQLPDAATRANKIPAFDSLGNPIVVIPPSGSASDVLIELAKPTGAGLVGYGSGTVKTALDSLKGTQTALLDKTGFNALGRFLNLSELRAQAPSSTGQIVYVASAASSTSAEKHYGGGYFQSFDNSTSALPDDGGIYIIPSTGALGWKRIMFTELDMTFWGVKPDSGIDNSAEILKAMTYVRSKKTTIRFPAGVVTSTQALPIWSECAIVGHGREVSQFVKTTNNGWPVASGVNIDALCVCLPDVYNPSGSTMDTFCMRPRIKGISLRRGSFTFANRSAYGIWGHKLAQAHFSDMLVLAANYGFYSISCFLMIQEQVSYSGVQGSYSGVYVANTLSGVYGRSGTTCNFIQVSVGGYNFGFFIAGLDSTRLTQCDAEGISLAAGESFACAYCWVNPMNCMMDCCYTEGVNGIMLRAINANNVSIANNLVVNCFNITPGETFTSPTRLMSIDSASLGTLKVTFIGGDIRNAVPGAGNMLPPIASGSNCVVKLIGGLSNPWDLTGGATYTEI